MTGEWEFEIWQLGVMVANGSGPNCDDVLREARHYFAQYQQDGKAALIFRGWEDLDD